MHAKAKTAERNGARNTRCMTLDKPSTTVRTLQEHWSMAQTSTGTEQGWPALGTKCKRAQITLLRERERLAPSPQDQSDILLGILDMRHSPVMRRDTLHQLQFEQL